MTDQPTPAKRITVDIIDYTYGQDIVREGDIGDRSFIIKFGEVEVVKTNASGDEVKIARLGMHEMFGEMCLFDELAPRSATVRAITDVVRVMAISREDFVSTVDGLPDGMRTLFRVLVQRLRDANEQITDLS